MNLYTQVARSHVGSSILFGSAFVPLAASDGLSAAASAAALAKKQDQAAAATTPEKAPSKVAASKDSPASPKKPTEA